MGKLELLCEEFGHELLPLPPEVFKVPKTKGIVLDKFDEIIGGFQFGVGIR
ncbi:Glycero-transferase [Streptococcus pneumoniae]|nr:Glycero-transferase [Streptococcus pneumoniae]